jgi:5-methylcytosine-specific restriction endonuclease McrA
MPKSTCLTCFRAIPVGSTYCKAHARKRAALANRTTTERGLGWDYQQARALVLSLSRLCCLCGKPNANSADHVVPRSKGGSNRLTNLIPSHLSCNSSRKAKGLAPIQMQRAREFQTQFASELNSKR